MKSEGWSSNLLTDSLSYGDLIRSSAPKCGVRVGIGTLLRRSNRPTYARIPYFGAPVVLNSIFISSFESGPSSQFVFSKYNIYI